MLARTLGTLLLTIETLSVGLNSFESLEDGNETMTLDSFLGTVLAVVIGVVESLVRMMMVIGMRFLLLFHSMRSRNNKALVMRLLMNNLLIILLLMTIVVVVVVELVVVTVKEGFLLLVNVGVEGLLIRSHLVGDRKLFLEGEKK